MEVWNFSKQTEKLSKQKIEVALAARFTAFAEDDSCLYFGSSKGDMIIYDIKSES